MYASRYNFILSTPEEGIKVILNPLTGALDFVDDEVVQFINQVERREDVQSEGVDSTLLNMCYDKGYLFHDEAEETEKLREFVETWYETMKSHAEHFDIYLTFACNLRCVYCYQREVDQDSTAVMTKDTVESLFKTIDFIHQERATKGSPSMNLYGGEPLLKRKKQVETVEEILRRSKENGYRVSVITNGIELSFYRSMLAEYGIERVQTTLDGPKDVHDKRRIFANGRGTFDKIVKGIDDILDENIPVGIRVNLDEQNIKYLPEMARFITEKKWLERGVIVRLCSASEGIEECFNEPDTRTYKKVFEMYTNHPETKIMPMHFKIPKFLEYILQYRNMPFPRVQYCWSTSGFLYSVDLHGNVFPCCCMNACCSSEAFSYGTFHPELKLNKDTFEAWRGRNILSLPQCRECKMALFCGGGCTRTAVQYGRSLKDGVACPLSFTERELQVVFNYYYPQLKEKAGI